MLFVATAIFADVKMVDVNACVTLDDEATDEMADTVRREKTVI